MCCAIRKKVRKKRPRPSPDGPATPSSLTTDRRRAYQAALAAAEATLKTQPDHPPALFERAALLAALGFDEAAQDAYVATLRRDPTHFGALTNLGGLALKRGHRAAALTAYREAADRHPDRAPAQVNLANLLLEDELFDAAERHYRRALRLEPECAEAHQGLAMLLTGQSRDAEAEPHWRRGFEGRAILTKPFRGEGEPLRVLLLVSARGGNIPTGLILDDRLFEVSALYAEFEASAPVLPAHDLVFNAIGDADLCREALAGAERVLTRTDAPLINRPEVVSHTRREQNASRMAALAGVVAPRIARLPRRTLLGGEGLNALMAAGLGYPVLLRSPGFHTGRHFVRVEAADDLRAAAAALPGDELLAIEPLDGVGIDGLARKFRVMTIGGRLYPLHMAAGADWKVHYFSSAMAERPDLRAEEARFLADMAAAIGPLAADALAAVCDRMDLDYAGVDFGVSARGELLFFEANAAMTIAPPDADPTWDYRRAAIDHALEAARKLLLTRAGVHAQTRVA
jgi:Flp pilus assembly protein TadD/glutathione synthase/RimK-type ligase-like ATP-grasp enzyme